ncbi:MAG TPA: hypothetical protein VMD77_04465 [Candidatus Baltobacteraceae bacterium]|nr:hypothetical protein [Candidatus Baltobacteraceae bacterium]
MTSGGPAIGFESRTRTLLFLLIGLAAITWSGYSLATGRGYYKGCPPGGYDRARDPFGFWAPTLIILGIGVFMMLMFVRALHG